MKKYTIKMPDGSSKVVEANYHEILDGFLRLYIKNKADSILTMKEVAIIASSQIVYVMIEDKE